MQDNFEENKKIVEKLIQCINDKKIDVMDELFNEDGIMNWPQSGEQIIGGENRRAVYKSFPKLPTITPKRIIGSGDLVIAEASLNYGDDKEYKSVFIFEFEAGKIKKETAYWSEPFAAPEWRAKWVTKLST